MLKVFLHDLRKVTHSVIPGIVILGLVLIPPLFTWFNVIATWDPFTNTRNLKVAIANTDAGYKSDLVPLRVNIGSLVLDRLRTNSDLEWVITDEETAVVGATDGTYYAAIVIPPEFSETMMTFYAPGSERTSIDYYTNEKKNPLAPKLTEQGASSVSNTINRVFAETLADVGMNVVLSVSDFLDEPEFQNALDRIAIRVTELSKTARASATTAQSFSDLAGQSTAIAESAQSLIDATKVNIDAQKQNLSDGDAGIKDIKAALTSVPDSLSTALTNSSDSYLALQSSADELFDSLSTDANDSIEAINNMADRVFIQRDQYRELSAHIEKDIRPHLLPVGQKSADKVIDLLNNAADRQERVGQAFQSTAQKAEEKKDSVEADRKDIKQSIADAKGAIDAAQNSFETDLKPQLDQLSAQVSTVKADVEDISSQLSAISSAAPPSSISRTLEGAQNDLAQASKSLSEFADELDDVSKKLAEVKSTGDLDALKELIGSNPDARAAIVSAPVAMNRVPLFKVGSFGAAMTPLYCMLALWVGALLTSVAIRVNVPEQLGVSRSSAYLGRYLTYFLVGLLQSTLTCLGLIFFVEVDAAHPFLLLLTGWLASAVFTLMTYTFVVLIGNAGKALSVLLLVMQISGSGGAYPLQLLPNWFSSISPFLPGTHVVAALRSSIAGIYGNEFWTQLGLLALFIPPVVALGLLMRGPLEGYNRRMDAAMERVKIM
ncbi:MAG: YhgE/Pip domain-containing protein [Actinomycetaceae bacterium]|nr:YhgE/Pip domain-containing protein [Actinomycetaceae bacterium]